MRTDKRTLNDKQKKIISTLSIAAFLVFCAAVTWLVGKPMLKLIAEPEKFRAWVEARGAWSWLIFIGMMVFQVIIALVPGEPFEIGAGYAFGAVEGTLLCVIGITIGSFIVFSLVRRFGVRLVEVFFTFEKIKSLKFLQNEKRLGVITFIVFFLPGTPKDLLTYIVGLTDMKLSRFLLIVTIARLPSVITSTVGGSALGLKRYTFAIIVFALTLVISLTGLLIYKKYCNSRNKM